MKKLYVLAISVLFAGNSFGQIQEGSTAPDFTFTDIYGTTQNLYSYLNQGKYVAIDVSATWCQPCWNYHTARVMDSLYDIHDVPGDNAWKVIFFEAFGGTDSLDLYGLTTNSKGNWVQGSDYMIINPPTGVELDNFINTYEVSFYPMFFLICPDKKIVQAALNGPRPTVAMWQAAADNNCFPAGIDNIEDVNPVTIYPNPAITSTTIYFSIHKSATVTLTVSNVLGQQVGKTEWKVQAGDQSLKYDVSSLTPGIYTFSISYSGDRIINKKVIIQ